ncbi:MAG TPA: hypothetical protein PK435_14925 [Thermoanaerobaculaceae bacterium]|nr:hypothetical protein [Thermoanaerobaculaceae bacterium]
MGILVGIALASRVLATPPPQSPPAAPATPGVYQPQPADVVTVGAWPAIGKWMIDRHFRPAEWLGARVNGKALREPINVVLVDSVAALADEARARLLEACRAAGYQPREGHSGGYQGYLGGVLFHQLPATAGHAFSNEPFELHNNHGRIFGPFRIKDGWLFIGALSRERFNPLTRTEHVYVSFGQAREDFARELDTRTGYKMAGFVELANSLTDDPALTTGDHDGMAVVLRARR